MIQNSQDKRVNVLYPTGLRVEHGDDGRVTPRGWGGGALEEVVVSTTYRAVAMTSASRAAAEACSSLRRRAMACTWA
jgi:hypothetical protein